MTDGGGAKPVATRRHFDQRAPQLHAQLLDAQHRLRQAGASVIVLVCGIETSGRNQLVNRLNQWLDSHGTETVGFWNDADGQATRPYDWRFWRCLPARGRVAILFDGWYRRVLEQRPARKMGKRQMRDALRRIAGFERMLAADGAIIVKLWCQVSRHEYRRRMRKVLARQDREQTAREKRYRKRFRRLQKTADRIIDVTDGPLARWTVIDAADRHDRDLAAGQALLAHVEERLAATPARTNARHVAPPRAQVLERIRAARARGRLRDADEIAEISARLNKLSWQAHEAGKSTIVVLEGMDASGKGGTARRISTALDARLVRVVPVGAPSDEERDHHYLWRFWRQVPAAGFVTVFDRSWYGRVLVERVEGLARPYEWRRAYDEINAFEQQLVEGGVCVVKVWLDVGKAEQLRRFREREKVRYKRYKITPEDWRNRDRWDAYRAAVDEMIGRTSTSHAPWIMIDANDKELARAAVLHTLCAQVEEVLT